MKKFNKSTTIVLSVIICLFLVVGFIFSFVPMTFGSKTYVSLFKSINVSSDLMGGMYGEYDITTEDPSEKDLKDSMKRIKEVFEGDGYKNVNVYTIGKKLRVEVSYPKGSKTYANVYSDLSTVAAGKFLLCSSSKTTEEGAVILDGSKCADAIKVFTNNSTNNLSVEFNKEGEEQFKALLKKSTTIYIHLGSYNQSISAEGVQDYSAFTLSDEDYDNLIALQKRIIIGCMSIEVNSNTAKINTMSANVSHGNVASSPEESGFASSTLMTIIASVSFIIVILGIAFFAINYGLYAVVIGVSLLINIYLTLILVCLMPSFELGFTTVMSFVFGLSLIYVFAFNYAKTIKSEYDLGKTFAASLEAGYKKNFANTVISNTAWLVMSVILVSFSFGELTSAAIVFAICGFLSLLTNLVVIPFLVKVAISYKKIDTKIFMLKKRAIGFGAIEDVNNEKEGE